MLRLQISHYAFYPRPKRGLVQNSQRTELFNNRPSILSVRTNVSVTFFAQLWREDSLFGLERAQASTL